MPYPIQLPDGRYDSTHTWQNANDRVEAERSFTLDPVEQAKMQAALLTANPDTPADLIREGMTTEGVPPRYGYDDQPITIDDMFRPDLGHVNDYAPTNYSGKVSEFSGTSTPSQPPW